MRRSPRWIATSYCRRVPADIQLSIGLPNFGTWLGPHGWHRFVDLARMADDAGIDRLVLVDHVVMGPHTDAYRWGRFPTPPDGDWLEPMTMLAAVAAATTRVRLATGIMIPALRGAALLAKTAASVDVISQGRLELGVGIGWQREEYDAVGLDWSQRGQLLDDTLGACTALWGDAPTTFDSPTVSFADVWCRPQPLQTGGVPLWIAGSLSPRNLRRLARWGRGWIPIMGANADEISEGATAIRTAMVEAERDPSELCVQQPLAIVRDDAGAADLAATLDGISSVTTRGPWAAHLPIQAFCRGLDDAAAFFAEAAERFAALA